MTYAAQNWLDRAIAWLSPGAALRRVQARTAYEIISRHQERYSYEGARSGRRTENWITNDTAANTEIGASLAQLRRRSRDLVRNNPYATGAIDEIVGYTVGTGIGARSSTSDPAVNARVDDAWKRWVDECDADGQLDFYGIQDLVARTVFESGECLVRRRQRLPKDGLLIPMQLQVLEPDFLDLSKTERLKSGWVIQGVEFDLIGQRVAYWLFSEHPGDVLTAGYGGSSQSHRVEARDIRHIYRKLRPGQVRGVPWLAPVVMKLRDIDEYEEAELVRKKVEACFVAFVTQSEPAADPSLGPSKTDSAGKRVETISPGLIEYLHAGEDVKFNEPKGSGAGYRDFMRGTQSTIARGIGLTYEQLTGDLSNVNYSSYRAGLLSFRNGIDGFRWKCIIPMFLQPVRRWFIDTAMLANLAPVGAYSTKWAPPKYGSVNPLQDAQATRALVRSGLQTWPDAVAEQGYDPDEQLDEIQKTFAEFDKRGFVLDCDPRRVSSTGVEQGSVTAEAAPNKAGASRSEAKE